MLKNYLKIAYRNLLKNKVFSLINIFGVAIGMATVVVIYLFVRYELSYDRFHEKADSIYRVYYYEYDQGKIVYRDPSTPAILAQTYQEEIPEVEEAVRLLDMGYFANPIISYEDKVFNESDVYFADANLPEVFDVKFLAGNPTTALQKPNSVVFTEAMAKKYFGDQDPLNRVVQLDIRDKKEPYIVTGVVAAFPPNAHLHFEALLSMASYEDSRNTGWLSNAYITYLLVREDTPIDRLQTNMDAVNRKHMNPQYEERFGKSYDAVLQEGKGLKYTLQPLTDIHLYSADFDDFDPHGDIMYVYLFVLIGCIILLIACANYVNLTTAKSAYRAREIGVRKVLGAGKVQLTKLFLTESLLVTVIAATLALTLVQGISVISQGFLSTFLSDSLKPDVLWVILGLTLTVGLLSGLIPAFYITAYQPVKVLKGELTKGGKGESLRNVLVITQFTISMGLIVCTLLVKEQLSYMQNKNLGFDKENVIVVDNVNKVGEKRTVLKQSLANEASIVNLAYCYNALGNPYNFQAFTPVENIENNDRSTIDIPEYISDADFLETLRLNLVMGHNFPENLSAEHQQIMLNEEAIRQIGWAHRSEEEIIGKMIDVNGIRYELAAVVEDFNFLSLKNRISPAAILSHRPHRNFDHLLIRIKPGNFQQTLQAIQKHWMRIASEVPFTYSFLDEDLDQLYRSELQIAYIFNIFSGLDILIACLGLLGLTMYTVERRTKEIGVRKVLGATVQHIVILLTRDITKLILIAFVIAVPLTWYAMHQWLENFAYRIDISVFTFLLAGGLTLAIALATISLQTIKAALTNPVKSLKYE